MLYTIRLLQIAGLIALLPLSSFSTDINKPSVDQISKQTNADLQPIFLTPVAIDGVPVDQVGQEFTPSQSPNAVCDGLWQGAVSGFLPSWFYGAESYAVYQDPNETGCSGTYPFTVNDVHMYMNAQGAATFDVQAMVWDYTGPDAIGAVLCTGPVLTYNFPGVGLYEIAPGLSSPCTVNGPYYAGIYYATNLGPDIIDILLDDGVAVPPRSDAAYNDWGSGWVDLVDEQGFPWNLLLWSTGETGSQTSSANIRIERTQNSVIGQNETVSIVVENSNLEMGGFDFLLAYEASVIALVDASPGQFLDDCEWEYFTYRTGSAEGNCGGSCPAGLLRIMAIAETNNGSFHPSCYGPPDTDPYELARITFQVQSDLGLLCDFVPIEFFWGDCGDNSISNDYGDILYLSDHVYDFEGTDITDSTFGFPTYFGVQTECLTGGNGDVRLINFHSGGIEISCVWNGCCGEFTAGQTGNADCDAEGKRNLADITRLIDNVYISKDALCCVENGNIDGDIDSKTNLADITKLIDHVYISKDETAVCE